MGFEKIQGQSAATSILRQAIIHGRVAQAYIFAGPEGVGKRLTAFTAAKAMNCQSPPEPGNCCEQCPSCVKINSANHADVILVEPEGELIRIDQVRILQRRLHYRPMEGGRRVCILDPADAMNEAASNALLKTLEEPPEETHLLLLTSRPHRLLPTIQSRCQWVKFKPLSAGLVMKILQEQHGLDGEKASFYASLSGGSVGRAVSLSDKVDFARRLEWLRVFMELPEKEMEEIWEACEKMSKDEDLQDLLDLWKIWLRDLAVHRIQGRGYINEDLKEGIAAESGKYSLDLLDSLYRLVSEAQRALLLNANRQLVLEALLLAIRHSSLPEQRRVSREI